MDPISMIVAALVAGAAAALKPTAEAAIKDVYAGIKTLIQDKYKGINVDLIESGIKSGSLSKSRQAVVKEDIEKTGAGNDEEILRQAKKLLDAVQNHESSLTAAAAVGIDLKDIQGASLTLERILAEGKSATGVKAEGMNITGDIRISDVQARSRADHPKP
jgi:hypothetical protein